MKRKSIIIAVSAVIAFVAVLAGCTAPDRVSMLSYPGINEAKVEMIGVMPFMLRETPQQRQGNHKLQNLSALVRSGRRRRRG